MSCQTIQILVQLGVNNACTLGDNAGACFIDKVLVGCSAIFAEQQLKELAVIGIDGVGNNSNTGSIHQGIALFVHSVGGVENLVQVIGLINSCVGDGNGTGFFSSKSSNAQGEYQYQCQNNCKYSFHNNFLSNCFMMFCFWIQSGA